jgi:hypothetical protein
MKHIILAMSLALALVAPSYAQGVEELPPIGYENPYAPAMVASLDGLSGVLTDGGLWLVVPSGVIGGEIVDQPDAKFSWMSNGVMVELFFFKTAGEEDDEFRDRVKTAVEWWKSIMPPDLAPVP